VPETLDAVRRNQPGSVLYRFRRVEDDLRRRRSAVTRSRVWQRPAWYTYPAGRLRFLTELRACGVHAISTRINRADRRHRGGFQVEFELTVPKLEARSGAGPVPLHNSGRQRWPAQPPLSPAPQRAGRVVFGPSGQR
jgi:hypothetical protein